MIELKEKRNLSSKTFAKDGQYVLRTHLGHLHYENKIMFGDGKKGLREIDYTLIWDEKRKGWYFNYGSFNPFIPEYSNDWAIFRDLYENKDREIKYQAVCEKVKGRLVKADELEKEGLILQTGFNCVVYNNVFGEGIDLIYALKNGGLKKLVRFRKGEYEIKDYDIVFNLSLPKEKLYRGYEKADSYVLDFSKIKELDTNKKILVGEDATYIEPFMIWSGDVEFKKEDIKVSFGDGKLVKHITADFLTKCNADVFTDTTTSFYPAKDASIYRNDQSTWAAARDGTSGTVDQASDGYNIIAERISSGYRVWRYFANFDTSALPTSPTITALTVGVIIPNLGSVIGDNYADSINIVQTSSASDTSFTANDFDNLTFTSGGSKAISTFSASDSVYNVITGNSTSYGWVVDNGYTKLGLILGRDLSNTSTTTTNNRNYIYIYSLNRTGTSQDPYLEVTYTAGGNQSNFFLLF